MFRSNESVLFKKNTKIIIVFLFLGALIFGISIFYINNEENIKYINDKSIKENKKIINDTIKKKISGEIGGGGTR